MSRPVVEQLKAAVEGAIPDAAKTEARFISERPWSSNTFNGARVRLAVDIRVEHGILPAPLLKVFGDDWQPELSGWLIADVERSNMSTSGKFARCELDILVVENTL